MHISGYFECFVHLIQRILLVGIEKQPSRCSERISVYWYGFGDELMYVGWYSEHKALISKGESNERPECPACPQHTLWQHIHFTNEFSQFTHSTVRPQTAENNKTNSQTRDIL